MSLVNDPKVVSLTSRRLKNIRTLQSEPVMPDAPALVFTTGSSSSQTLLAGFCDVQSITYSARALASTD